MEARSRKARALTLRFSQSLARRRQRFSQASVERLQAQYPCIYPDGQLRTCQRRLKVWRREMAHKLVFGADGAAEPAMASEAQ